ncbi:MAG: NADH:flavin oxidoreductase, partial [Thermoleophilia bacterium]|nr:NADH:flavin oxidoreductase [Thermoleophilia bacterium]
MTRSADARAARDGSVIFRPWRLGSLDVPNRLVRSATEEGLSTGDGAPTRRLIDLTADLARGGAGLIVAGSMFICREGRGATNVTGIDRDALIRPLGRMCDAVHAAGGLLAAQLLHSGSTLRPVMVAEKEGPYGPSPETEDPVCGAPVRAMTKAQIAGVVDLYAQAASRARRAGFDAVQIHAAHGYLLDQFLSPARNRREDAYGGSLQRRARLLYEVYEAVRGAVGAGYPVFIKMSAHDGWPGGVQP